MAMAARPFKVQIMSDLHLDVERAEYLKYEFEFEKTAPNLALLGNIGATRDARLFTWIEAQLERFERVFYVPGNREPYGSTLEESNKYLESFAVDYSKRDRSSKNGEFILLNQGRYDVSDTLTILGCTLWGNLNPGDQITVRNTSDFTKINEFTPASYIAAHKADVQWLTKSIEAIRQNEPSREITVFTHHTPTVDGAGNDSTPRFSEHHLAFATELRGTTCWAPPVVFWGTGYTGFGHFQFTREFEADGVRVVTNQRGFSGNGTFDPTKAVEI